MAPEERKTVLRAIAGDDAAFAELVARNQAWVRGLLTRACGDGARADDVAQTAFFRAWRKIGALRNPATFHGWLRRIAINAAIDARRADRGSPDPLNEETLAAPGSGVTTADERLDLEAALARLSFAARTCMILFHAEGMTHPEIAAETGMPVGTVKSHIARATPLMRAWLKAWRPDHGD